MLVGRVFVLVLLPEDEGSHLLVVIHGGFAFVIASLNAVLSIIASSSCVGEAEDDLDARDDNSSKEAV